MAASADTRLVVFDGLCNVCSGGARFLQSHEIKSPFRGGTVADNLVPRSDHREAAVDRHDGAMQIPRVF